MGSNPTGPTKLVIARTPDTSRLLSACPVPVGLRDAEHGNDAAGPNDLDLGDQGRGFRIELGVEFVPAGGELSGPAFELGDRPAQGLWLAAGFSIWP